MPKRWMQLMDLQKKESILGSTGPLEGKRRVRSKCWSERKGLRNDRSGGYVDPCDISAERLGVAALNIDGTERAS